MISCLVKLPVSLKDVNRESKKPLPSVMENEWSIDVKDTNYRQTQRSNKNKFWRHTCCTLINSFFVVVLPVLSLIKKIKFKF